MKTITITLSKASIILDVNNVAYFTGRSRSTGDNPEQVANMQSDEEEECVIRRFVHNAAEKVKTSLSAVLKKSEKETDSSTNDLTKDSIVYELELNSNFDMNLTGTIASGVHDSIVNSTLGEWFLIANPAEASVYFDKAGANLQNVRHAIHKRVKPLRREPSV